MTTLKQILNFHGTTLAALLSSTPGEGRVTRHGKRRTLSGRFNGVTIEQLAHGPVAMEAQLFAVDPGGGSEGAYSHEGEEFVYVLAGAFEVMLGPHEQYRLRPGDCLYYPSTMEHRWRNPGRQVARLLWVNTPPTF